MLCSRVSYDDSSFGITTINAKGEETYCPRGKVFLIRHIKEDVDSGEVYYTVGVFKLGEPNKFTIPKSDAMDANKVLGYCKEGLDVNASNARIVTEVFQLKEDEFLEEGGEVKQVYSVAGVRKCQDDDGNQVKVFAGFKNPVNGDSYIGNFDLKPKGDSKKWFSFVKSELEGQVSLMFIVALSFAPILMGFFGNKVDVDNLIVHLRGDSSSGKTTMMNLAISAYGNPSEKCPNGLISTWNGTKNAILKRLMNVNGMLLGLDEFSMFNSNDVTGLMYSMASGIEKDRLTRNAEVQERQTGTYIVLTTGEASILNKTSGNIGLSMRVLEFDSMAWTRSAEQSERIKKFVKSNYGHAATEFGSKLSDLILEDGEDELLEQYEQWRDYYTSRCTIQARKERISGRYALILLSAQLANDFFDMGMDIPAICDFIIANENSNEDDRDSYNHFYDKFVSYYLSNKEHFGYVRDTQEETGDRSESEIVLPVRENWGFVENVSKKITVDGTPAQKAVYVLKHVFDNIVGQLGYEDPKAIRRWLKRKGYSRCEKDRDSLRRTVQGIRAEYVVVYLAGDASPEETDETAGTRKKGKSAGKLRKKALLEDEE